METDITNQTNQNQTTTDLSGGAALKRVVSTRPNKGFNSKYDTKTYLGLQNPPILDNQNEGTEAVARPFSLVASSSQGPQTRRQVHNQSKKFENKIMDCHSDDMNSENSENIDVIDESSSDLESK